MRVMFAQGLEAVPAEHFKWTIVIIIGLALLGLQIYSVMRERKTSITPDPLRVEKLDKFATRDFCMSQHSEVSRRLDAHDSEFRRIYDQMKMDSAANQVHASERSKTLFNEVKAVREELTAKIDSMPDRIIKLLNDLHLLNNGGKQ